MGSWATRLEDQHTTEKANQMWYPKLTLFARAEPNYKLKDLVRMVRIESAEAYRTRWQQTVQAIMDDELEVKGRRILSLAALLEDGLEQTRDDFAYIANNTFVRTLPKDLPGFDALLPRLQNAMDRHLPPHGPWVPYKRSFYIPIQSYDPPKRNKPMTQLHDNAL